MKCWLARCLPVSIPLSACHHSHFTDEGLEVGTTPRRGSTSTHPQHQLPSPPRQCLSTCQHHRDPTDFQNIQASSYNLSSSGYYSFFNANLKECVWGGITMSFQFILLFLLIRLNICPHYLLVNCIFFSLAFRALYNLNLPFSPYLLLVKPTNIY